jgi:hypothetical protein
MGLCGHHRPPIWTIAFDGVAPPRPHGPQLRSRPSSPNQRPVDATVGSGPRWQAGHTPQKMSSVSSMTNPAVCGGSRQGAFDRTQSTSTATRQLRQMMWWWLSSTRVSKRAGPPAGWICRANPTLTRAASTSYIACVEIEPVRSRAETAMSPTARWSPARTAASTASRGAVTRRPAARNRWESSSAESCGAADIGRSVALVWSESNRRLAQT